MKLEEAGRPAVVIATERFAAMARRAAKGFGMAEARIVVVPHPIGGEPDDALRAMAERATPAAMDHFLDVRDVEGRDAG